MTRTKHALPSDQLIPLIERSGFFLVQGKVTAERQNVTVSLSDRALHFLQSLYEIGLVDAAMGEEILARIMLTCQGEVTFEQMKQTAAIVIFERQFGPADDDYGIFEEEWKLLFH